mmetsp:Transcript_76312/g.124041  ORF Transcript_76312/g.124041 Transcript_76312/m.124041 type:complete len:304 (-) Transcript_76312:418-1329(-)
MSARLEIIISFGYRPSSCRHPAALLFESQSIHIISLSLNRSFDSMLLPKTLYLKQRMMVVPKHVQQAAIISARIPNPSTITKMLAIFWCICVDAELSEVPVLFEFVLLLLSPKVATTAGAGLSPEVGAAAIALAEPPFSAGVAAVVITVGCSCSASASTASSPSFGIVCGGGLSKGLPLFMTSFAGCFGRSNTRPPVESWWCGKSPPGCPCIVPSACVCAGPSLSSSTRWCLLAPDSALARMPAAKVPVAAAKVPVAAAARVVSSGIIEPSAAWWCGLSPPACKCSSPSVCAWAASASASASA